MIHVIYTIHKKGSSTNHDIIVHSNIYWKDGKLVTGGIVESIHKDYPEDLFTIDVEVLTSTGNQTDD